MAANQLDNKFSVSWHDSAWIPILNAENVLDYFCQRSNTFYNKTCNNEHVKMQRLHPSQLQYANNEHVKIQRLHPNQLTFMTGVEYELIHAQDPILYVIKKQNRHSPTHVVPLAFYYVLAGVVYQAPDVGSLINSRLLSTIYKLQTAFAEAQSYAKYTPSKGYWWQFKDTPTEAKKIEKKTNKAHEPSTAFQRQRVDLLLADFAQKFPPKIVQSQAKETPGDVKVETPSTEITTATDNKDDTASTIAPPVKVGSPEQVTIAQMIAASADNTLKTGAPQPKKKKKD